jgi:anti-sigma regulatory factor (Ser/Thr protein kinase)
VLLGVWGGAGVGGPDADRAEGCQATMSALAFRHELLEYAGGADGFIARTAPLIERAVAREEPVLVAIPSERIELLREALGDDGERVGFTDMHELGRNPGRIISAWHDFLTIHGSAGPHALGIGEPIWPGRSAAELSECHNHEALLNLAFGGGRPWQLICPYDVDGLDDQVIEAAQRNHAFVAEQGMRDGDARRQSPNPARPFEQPLPEPGGDVRELSFASAQLGRLRHTLTAWAREQRLAADPTEELVLAVNELATNSIRHGGGEGKLRLWRETDTLVCEIRDAGHIEDPLIGRSRPAPNQHTGRGLWLVHQLCDLVQIHSSPAGTAVRVHKRAVDASGA